MLNLSLHNFEIDGNWYSQSDASIDWSTILNGTRNIQIPNHKWQWNQNQCSKTDTIYKYGYSSGVLCDTFSNEQQSQLATNTKYKLDYYPSKWVPLEIEPKRNTYDLTNIYYLISNRDLMICFAFERIFVNAATYINVVFNKNDQIFCNKSIGSEWNGLCLNRTDSDLQISFTIILDDISNNELIISEWNSTLLHYVTLRTVNMSDAHSKYYYKSEDNVVEAAMNNKQIKASPFGYICEMNNTLAICSIINKIGAFYETCIDLRKLGYEEMHFNSISLNSRSIRKGVSKDLSETQKQQQHSRRILNMYSKLYTHSHSHDNLDSDIVSDSTSNSHPGGLHSHLHSHSHSHSHSHNHSHPNGKSQPKGKSQPCIHSPHLNSAANQPPINPIPPPTTVSTSNPVPSESASTTTNIPVLQPIYISNSPSNTPTQNPLHQPTKMIPSETPIGIPTPNQWTTKLPTEPNSNNPTIAMTSDPSLLSTKNPSITPTNNPSITPIKNPSITPTMTVTNYPSITSTNNPSITSTNYPSITPTNDPSLLPTKNPSVTPTMTMTNYPSLSPTNNPSKTPTNNPTTALTNNPSLTPTNNPSKTQTNNPSITPTNNPSRTPTVHPTVKPTRLPIFPHQSHHPTPDPTVYPTTQPTPMPTIFPTQYPTNVPSVIPTNNPSLTPTNNPSKTPTNNPSITPTNNPSMTPTIHPTIKPTRPPIYPHQSHHPTPDPTVYPTIQPTPMPTMFPTQYPTNYATMRPTRGPIYPHQTHNPTPIPTVNPTLSPTSISNRIELYMFYNETRDEYWKLQPSKYSQLIEESLLISLQTVTGKSMIYETKDLYTNKTWKHGGIVDYKTCYVFNYKVTNDPICPYIFDINSLNYDAQFGAVAEFSFVSDNDVNGFKKYIIKNINSNELFHEFDETLNTLSSNNRRLLEEITTQNNTIIIALFVLDIFNMRTITPTSLQTTIGKDKDDPDEILTREELIGLVIIITLLVICILFGIWWFVAKRKKVEDYVALPQQAQDDDIAAAMDEKKQGDELDEDDDDAYSSDDEARPLTTAKQKGYDESVYLSKAQIMQQKRTGGGILLKDNNDEMREGFIDIYEYKNDDIYSDSMDSVNKLKQAKIVQLNKDKFERIVDNDENKNEDKKELQLNEDIKIEMDNNNIENENVNVKEKRKNIIKGGVQIYRESRGINKRKSINKFKQPNKFEQMIKKQNEKQGENELNKMKKSDKNDD